MDAWRYDHWGDNQPYDLYLTIATDDPTVWRVENQDFAAFWWSDPPPTGDFAGVRDAALVASDLHPVLMFSQGNHHDRKGTGDCEYSGGGDLPETWWCPERGSSWRDHWWAGPGLSLPLVIGNVAFPEYDRSPGFALTRGNNVGESDPGRHGPPFAYDLSEFCIFRWNPWAEPPYTNEPSDPWCFYDEYAWDDRHFNGGHRATEGIDDAPSPMNNVWRRLDGAFLDDLDGDTVPNATDVCYLDPFDHGAGVWPVSGVYSTELDGDGDGVVDECDGCPEDPQSWETTDADLDGVPDGCDFCPMSPGTRETDYRPRMGVASSMDADADGIGDTCDLCPHRARTDSGPVEASTQYNRSPEFGSEQDPDRPFDNMRAPATADSDGDNVGDACDLCPFLPGGSFPYTWCNEDDADCMAAVGINQDQDGDFVGVRCDNCPTVSNADQYNCNEADERTRYLRRPGTTEGGFVGHGDACDATPCVVKCKSLLGSSGAEIMGSGKVERVSAVPGHEGERCDGTHSPTGVEDCTCYDGEPASIGICTVGFADPDANEDYDPSLGAHDDPGGGHDQASRNFTLSLQTWFWRCACTDAEMDSHQCGETRCPQQGGDGTEGRWKQASWPDQPSDGAGEPAHPPYNYRRLYLGSDSRDPTSARWETTGDWFSWYAPYTRSPDAFDPAEDGRYIVQKWNFLTDHGDLTDDSGAPLFTRDQARDSFLWLEPARSLVAGYGGWSRQDEGNRYLSARLGGNAHDCRFGDGPVWERLVDIIGPYHTPYGSEAWGPIGKAPLKPAFAALLGGDCIYCVDYLFDDPGDHVGGLLVYGWDAAGKQYANLVGSKVVDGRFALRESSLTFLQLGRDGIDAYATFGGVDAAGGKSDQFWVAALQQPMIIGTEEPRAYFALSEVSRGSNAPWPSARIGSALAPGTFRSEFSLGGGPVTGGSWGDAAGAASGGGPPAPEKARARVVLVGGEGDDGLLDDIWLYDGQWRLVGALPGVDDGLTEAGSAVVDQHLWLFGGRQSSGPSDDLWKIDLDTGAAVKLTAGVGPSPRVQPALAFRPATSELLVFGGTAGGVAFNDLWAFNLGSETWRRVAGPCSGTGCPVTVGREKLLPDAAGAGITVLANPAGAARADWAWTLAAGTWESLAESYAMDETKDCDGDGMADLGWGARCGAGGAGFPFQGRMRCDPASTTLVCRAPSAPAEIVAEHRTPGIQAVVAANGFVGAVKEREIQWNRLESDGALVPVRTVRFSRPANDVALAGDYALVADRSGLTVYSLVDGTETARLPTCGKARRVFVDGGRAYVLGLRSILVLDVTNPAAPTVLTDLRVAALPSGLAWATPATGCSAFHTVADLVCDASGFCPLVGRVAADEDGHRLYLDLLGYVHVLDFRGGLLPTFSPPVRTGLATALRADGDLLYVNRSCGEASKYAWEDGIWTHAGPHDVPDWVSGTAATGAFAMRKGPAALYVAERQ